MTTSFSKDVANLAKFYFSDNYRIICDFIKEDGKDVGCIYIRKSDKQLFTIIINASTVLVHIKNTDIPLSISDLREYTGELHSLDSFMTSLKSMICNQD